MFIQRIKPLHITIAITALLVIVIGAIVASQIYTAANPIEINKVPSDAKVYVNNKEIVGSRTNLPNGTYAVRAHKDGFHEYTATAVIDDNTKYITIALEPESDAAKTWAENNQAAYLELEEKTGSLVGESGKALLDKNPIIADLPIDNYTSAVGYIINPNDISGNSIIVTVDALTGYRNAAVESIYNAGYDPGDYTIQFKDYQNPFEENK